MFRFSIRELLLVTAIVALATGWWVDRRGSRSMVQVFFKSSVGQDEHIECPFVPTLTVQQILVQTGGDKKYRQCEVELCRQLSSGGFYKIPCEFDFVAKQVDPSNDYVLLPGDHVIVKDVSLASAKTLGMAHAPHAPSK